MSPPGLERTETLTTVSSRPRLPFRLISVQAAYIILASSFLRPVAAQVPRHVLLVPVQHRPVPATDLLQPPMAGRTRQFWRNAHPAGPGLHRDVVSLDVKAPSGPARPRMTWLCPSSRPSRVQSSTRGRCTAAHGRSLSRWIPCCGGWRASRLPAAS